MSWLKSGGIIASYLLVVIGVYVFDWSISAIFWTYYFELIVLLVYYVIIRSIDQHRNPSKYRKLPGALNIFFAAGPLLIIQFLFLSFIEAQLSGDGYKSIYAMMNSNGGWITLSVLVIVYLLRAVNFKSIKEQEFELQQNFFLEILALSGTNMLGFIAAAYIDTVGSITLLSIMIAGRIAIELYFRYKTKWI